VLERWGYPRAVGSQTVAVAGKEHCGKLGPSRVPAYIGRSST
jgi:hypothetical protein